MLILVAGSSPRHRLRRAGFTLLELLVVLSIIAIGTAGVTLALRDPSESVVQRDAERLAVLLENGRAVSRTRGVAVTWYPQRESFHFDGVAADAMPQSWLDRDTRSLSTNPVVLGPEPMIGAQEIVVGNVAGTVRWRVTTDGLRPFTAAPGAAAVTGGGL